MTTNGYVRDLSSIAGAWQVAVSMHFEQIPSGLHIPAQIVQGSDFGSQLKRVGNYAIGSPRRVTELP